MNKYLEKIANSTKKDEKPSWLRTGAELGIGALATKRVPSHLLGYHTVYHGTAKEHSSEIHKNGFDPNKGGSGAAGHSNKENFKENSKGKVHVTKRRDTARFFAGYTQHGVDNPAKGNAKDMFRHTNATEAGLKNMFTGNNGEVIKARISDMAWHKDFEVDPDMGGLKSTAATTTKRIGVGSINKERKAFANKSHLGKYYSSTRGKLRALGGVAYGIGGGALIAHAIHQRMKKDE